MKDMEELEDKQLPVEGKLRSGARRDTGGAADAGEELSPPDLDGLRRRRAYDDLIAEMLLRGVSWV